MAGIILGFIWMIIRIVICMPFLLGFLAGDKEKRETLWYGMAALLLVIAFK